MQQFCTSDLCGGVGSIGVPTATKLTWREDFASQSEWMSVERRSTTSVMAYRTTDHRLLEVLETSQLPEPTICPGVKRVLRNPTVQHILTLRTC
jgi:hypothetical protein